MTNDNTQTTLVVGGTGLTGRRVAARLTALGRPVRIGTRSSRLDVLSEVFAELREPDDASTTDDVERVLGRPPRDFTAFTAAAWSSVAVPAVSGR